MRYKPTISVGKHEGKRPLERLRRRWGTVLKLVSGTEMEGVDWVHQDKEGHGPMAGSYGHGNEASGSVKVGKFRN